MNPGEARLPGFGRGRMVEWSATILAVRDEGWCLCTATIDFDGSVLQFLGISGVDDSGRLTHSAQLPVDDLSSAVAQMDDWWLEGGTPAQLERYRVARQYGDASDYHDGERLMTIVADDFVYVDRRSVVGTGTLDRAGLVEAMSTWEAQVRTLCVHVERSSATCFVGSMVTDEVAGFGAENRFRLLLHATGGVVRRVELFDVDDDAAFARFHELTAAVGTDESAMANAASAVVDAFVEAISAGDREAASALCVRTWSTAEYGLSIGNDWGTALQSFFEPPFAGATWGSELLLTRGDTWCVHRNEVASDGNVIPFLVLTGVDETGTRATHCAVFLEDAFAEVLALLDEWAPPAGATPA